MKTGKGILLIMK